MGSKGHTNVCSIGTRDVSAENRRKSRHECIGVVMADGPPTKDDIVLCDGVSEMCLSYPGEASTFWRYDQG